MKRQEEQGSSEMSLGLVFNMKNLKVLYYSFIVCSFHKYLLNLHYMLGSGLGYKKSDTIRDSVPVLKELVF